MTTQGISPKEIAMRRSSKERLEYFKSRTIKHPSLTGAYEDVRSAILDASPGSIILLFGPTGVGKTTLLGRLAENLTESILSDLDRDNARIPVALVRLDPPLPGRFDWKDYFKGLLAELKEPQIERKICIEGCSKSDGGRSITADTIAGFSSHTPCGVMRASAIQALKYRNPLAVLVDDAQHFGQVGSGRKLLDQLNIIKSMAEKSRVTTVLAGTYELLPFLNLNGQLSRRSIDVHFGRYHADEEAEQDAFINALFTFQQHLPLVETPMLTSQWDYFYEGSIGCIGILKDWLARSLALALKDKSSTLLPEHLERRMLNPGKRASILREIDTGEKYLTVDECELAQLRIKMGLWPDGKKLTLQVRETCQVEDAPEPKLKARQKGRKSQVGRRSPQRDKVGGGVR